MWVLLYRDISRSLVRFRSFFAGFGRWSPRWIFAKAEAQASVPYVLSSHMDPFTCAKGEHVSKKEDFVGSSRDATRQPTLLRGRERDKNAP